MRYLVIILVAVFVVAGYGYRHAVSHGALYISVYDSSDEKSYAQLKNVQVMLRDKDGTELARGRSEDDYGTIYLEHPEAGSCYEKDYAVAQSPAGKNAWQRCFETQSTWLIAWIRQVSVVDVHLPGCDLPNIPISVREGEPDWWLWWVPLPHVGGKPYTYFSLTLRIDPQRCQVSG